MNGSAQPVESSASLPLEGYVCEMPDEPEARRSGYHEFEAYRRELDASLLEELEP